MKNRIRLGGALFVCGVGIVAACADAPRTEQAEAPEGGAPAQTTEALAPPEGARTEALRATNVAAPEGPVPIHSVPFRQGPVRAANACGGTPPHLNYYGGPVLQNVRIYNVNWGSHVDPTVSNTSTGIPAFYAGVTQTPYWDWLSEYNTVGVPPAAGGTGTSQGISRGSYGGSFTIATPAVGDCTTGAEPGCTVADADIQNELAARFGNILPNPTQGCDGFDNAIYMINFNPNVTINGAGGSSCVPGGFCAYHGTMTFGGHDVAYGVMPDMVTGACNTGCGTFATGDIKNTSAVASHELAEAATDTAVGLATVVGPPLAWYDTNCGEIGDICNDQENTISFGGQTWGVQQLWSNAANNCIVTKASLPPICASPGATGCRKCACSDNNEGAPGQVGCSGATPWCETDSTNIKGGECVQCTITSECPSGDTCTKSTTVATDDTCTVTCGANGTVCCAGNTCSGPAPDQCHQAGTCTGGTCTNPAVSNGTTCNDGNACTTGDQCTGGTCGGTPIVCTALDQCHVAGTCSGGTCSNPTKSNGSTCDDGDPCTTNDQCTSGKCAGTPVVCTALDQCHVAGTCSAGVCSNPTKADGSTCNDGNACTQTDTCQAGTCSGSNPVTCTALDQCHVAGTCNPGSGVCSNPNKANGTTCDDKNACTQTDTCQSGTCTGSLPVICTALDQCHVAGTCNPANGVCSNPDKANGTTCSDGNACTTGDTCNNGTCGGNAVVCTALDQCHVAGTCDPASGACTNPNRANGTTCDDKDACTQTDTCQSGTCTGTNPIVCTASDQCHAVGTCNASTGACSNPPVANGTGCSDGNACTLGDTCQSGTCTSGSPLVCTAEDQCHVVGTCNPANGTCSNPSKANGSTCNDGNACTKTDTCQSGACVGTNPTTCTASDQCHTAGTCDPVSGACSNPDAPNGTTCNTGSLCSTAGVCTNGSCSGTSVTCTASDQCHVAGTCDPANGTCSNPAANNGTTCNDGNTCTTNDVCTSGTCAGVPVVCVPLDECHVAGACSAGACTNPEKPNGTACSVGACENGVCTATGSDGGSGTDSGSGGGTDSGSGNGGPTDSGSGGTDSGSGGGTDSGSGGGTDSGSGGTDSGSGGTDSGSGGTDSGSGGGDDSGSGIDSGSGGTDSGSGSGSDSGSGSGADSGSGDDSGTSSGGDDSGSGNGGPTDSGAGNGGATDSGSSADAGAGDDGGSGGGVGVPSGCGCRTVGSEPRESGTFLAFGVIGLVGVARARRRRR